MAIELEGTTPEPALDFKNIFLKELTLRQDYTYLVTDAPKYNLVVYYQVYAITSSTRVFKPEILELQVEDYLAMAQDKIVTSSDYSLLDAISAIQLAFSTILTDKGSSSLVVA